MRLSLRLESRARVPAWISCAGATARAALLALGTAVPLLGGLALTLLVGLALTLLVGLAATLLVGAPEAHAHGGMFQGPPQPPVPPLMRNPRDFVPPPPPPPTIGPPPPITPGLPSMPTTPRTGPGGQGPRTPGANPTQPTTPPRLSPTTPGMPGMPGMPGTGLVGPTTPGGSRPLPPVAAASDAWTTWWQLNRWAYLPLRTQGLSERLAVTTPSPDTGIDPLALWEHRRRLLASNLAVPQLLRQLDPRARVDDPVRAAGLIALARLATNAAHVAVIQIFAEDARQPLVVRESACIALGLLRRTGDAKPLDASGTDSLRRKLFSYFDDDTFPTRARAMALISLGLLADQPYGSQFTKDGRVVTHMLWDRLSVRWGHPELPVALLTALGMQPAAGVPESVRTGLQQIVLGKRVNGVKWSVLSRSHALTARLRLGGPATTALLLRVLPSRRVPRSVAESAWIGLIGAADHLTSKERMQAYDALQRAYPRISEPVTRGMALLALGRLIETDLLGNPDSPLLYQNAGPALLLRQARIATGQTRGFAALGLGLAVRHAREGSRRGLQFRKDALALLEKAFTRDARAIQTRGAYAIALGLAGAEPAAAAIAASLADTTERPLNRAHAAEALALLGTDDPTVRRALRAALLDRRAADVRARAAVALSSLARGDDGALLIRALAESRTQRELGQIAVAIGYLGDLRAARTLVSVATDKKNMDENRALGLAALGLLLDPERRPSLTRLRLHANYRARTSSLHEVLDIL